MPELTPDPREAERLLAGVLSNPAASGLDWTPPSVEALRNELPGYEVLRLLGRGGMGAVFHGRHRELDREVAIKILPPELSADPEFTERFRREAQTMAKLDHPAITRVFDFGKTPGGLHFIVMEFCEGRDLGHWIRSGKLSPAQSLRVVIEVCEALEFAHQRGFVHRDIKPGNIFLQADSSVKIGDFGLARLADSQTATLDDQLTASGMGVGSPAYMAPEQLLGEGESAADPRSDLYALGVTLYEMLTGQLPRGSFAPPSASAAEVDSRVDSVVDRALQPEPEDRYQSAADLREDLEPIGSVPAERSRNSKAVWIAALVSVGLILAALVLWFGQDAFFGPGEDSRELPDLIVVEFRVAPAGDDNLELIASVVIKNSGSATYFGSDDNRRARAEAIFNASNFATGSRSAFREIDGDLAPGETWSRDFPVRNLRSAADPPAEFTVKVVLDIDEQVEEASETNNSALGTYRWNSDGSHEFSSP